MGNVNIRCKPRSDTLTDTYAPLEVEYVWKAASPKMNANNGTDLTTDIQHHCEHIRTF